MKHRRDPVLAAGDREGLLELLQLAAPTDEVRPMPVKIRERRRIRGVEPAKNVALGGPIFGLDPQEIGGLLAGAADASAAVKSLLEAIDQAGVPTQDTATVVAMFT